MNTLIKGIKITSLLIFTLAFWNCSDDDDTVLPEVEALFTHTINQNSGAVTFINASSNAETYFWDFGDGTTSTEINPNNVYATGTYTIVLTAKNAAGGEDTFEDTISIQIPEPITIPINFDNPLVAYNATTFQGAAFEVIDNPDVSGANSTASKVGAITNIGAAFEGLSFDLGVALNLTTDKSMTMKFWSETPTTVLLKLEEGTGPQVETLVNHGGSGWEDIYFTFDSASSYSKITLFVDGAGTTAGTFYIDDITQLNTADVPCLITALEFPFDFDCESTDYATKIVGDVSFTVVDNSELSGINAEASKVGQITNVGNPFENAFFNLDTPIDFSADKGVRVKLFSNQALPVLLKFEDGTADNVENSQMHGGTGWEELTFTLNSSASFNDMVLFIDGPGNAVGTFYVDDFEQVAVAVGAPCTPETTQSLSAADFNLTFLNDPTASIISDGAGFAWIDNPDFDNMVNPSCKVGQIERTSAAMFANNQIILDNTIDFNANTGFKLKVWSATGGTNVLLKLEDQDDANTFKEVTAVTSGDSAMQWEELTFNFAPGDSGKFDKIVLFFELATATQAIYYIDDLVLFSDGGGTTGDCPAPPTGDFISDGDFEADAECWVLFDNGGTTTISSTVSNGGGTRSGQIQSAAGANPGIKQERFGAGTVTPNTTYTISFDVKADASNPLVDGAILNAFMFSETAEGSGLPADMHPLVQGDGAVSSNWETRNYTFTTGGNIDGGVSILFELVCGGAASCGGIINIDNVSMTAQ